MKKQYLLILLILLAVLVLAGCAPSWQPPIMGPDPAPIGLSIALTSG